MAAGVPRGWINRTHRGARPQTNTPHSGFRMPQTEPETWFEGSLAELIAQAILIPGMTWPQRYLRIEMDALMKARAKLPEKLPDDLFEAWLIDRWLWHIRSPEFQL